MSFKTWYKWLGQLPPLLRWFPILVLLRPLIDNLYFLKEASPLLSPPYIVGALTPILCIAALVKYRFPRAGVLDKTIMPWAVLTLFGCLMLLFYDASSLLTFEFLLKLSLPVYLYFFLRLLIVSRRDLDGVLTSFLYSGVFVAGLLLYELLVHPISVQGSRGLERIQGSFGDVVSYGMYIVFALVVATYFYFSRRGSVSEWRRVTLVALVAVLGLLGLFNIHHTATYTVFALTLLLFVFFNFRKGEPIVALALMLALGVMFDFAGSEIVDEKISPLLQTDLKVYAGQADSDRLLHGRVGRWRAMLTDFSTEPIGVQFLGYPLKFEYVYQYIGIGSHNDFLRVLFASGVAGLLAYVAFLGTVFRRVKSLAVAQRYLVLAGFIALLLYSISVTPTMYAPFMYFVLTLFAFVALPPKNRAA